MAACAAIPGVLEEVAGCGAPGRWVWPPPGLTPSTSRHKCRPCTLLPAEKDGARVVWPRGLWRAHKIKSAAMGVRGSRGPALAGGLLLLRRLPRSLVFANLRTQTSENAGPVPLTTCSLKPRGERGTWEAVPAVVDGGEAQSCCGGGTQKSPRGPLQPGLTVRAGR